MVLGLDVSSCPEAGLSLLLPNGNSLVIFYCCYNVRHSHGGQKRLFISGRQLLLHGNCVNLHRLRPFPVVSVETLLPAPHSQFEITSWHYAIKGTIAVVGKNTAALKWLCGTPRRRNFPETVGDYVSVFEAVHIAGGATRMVQTIRPSVTSQVWGNAPVCVV